LSDFARRRPGEAHAFDPKQFIMLLSFAFVSVTMTTVLACQAVLKLVQEIPLKTASR
jgi:hypothetical protein